MVSAEQRFLEACTAHKAARARGKVRVLKFVARKRIPLRKLVIKLRGQTIVKHYKPGTTIWVPVPRSTNFMCCLTDEQEHLYYAATPKTRLVPHTDHYCLVSGQQAVQS
jgi:hypothetical protein